MHKQVSNVRVFFLRPWQEDDDASAVSVQALQGILSAFVLNQGLVYIHYPVQIIDTICACNTYAHAVMQRPRYATKARRKNKGSGGSAERVVPCSGTLASALTIHPSQWVDAAKDY
jgi:hypothetical protein